MGVSMNPGSIAFTLMPNGPSSFARDTVMPLMAALDALYTDCPALPYVPTTDPTFTMQPLKNAHSLFYKGPETNAGLIGIDGFSGSSGLTASFLCHFPGGGFG